ncbi:MAG: RND family efflux transporter MFP subunit [Gammaproteobacteria bacterium]|jgi:RND family efflux transporter MFP subunit
MNLLPIIALAALLSANIAYSQTAFAGAIPELDCVIEPHEVVEVSSAAEGIIESINVERNDLIKKGQVLATLESDVEKASLAFAHLNASLNTEIGLRRASLDFDQRNRTRIDELYVKKAIPLHHKDEAATDAEKSKWLLTKAQDDKRLAALELVRAKAVVNRKTVRSPIDGVVVARHKSTGEYIEDQPIITVAQLHPLRVEVIVPVELFGAIQNGMSATVIPELVSSGRRHAKVVSVDRVIDGASGTFDVSLELPNEDYQIPSGLKCLVEFDDPTGAQIETVGLEPKSHETITSEKDESFRNLQAAAIAFSDTDGDVKNSTTNLAECTAIGPLNTDGEADQVSAALSKVAAKVTRSRQLETVIDSYLVAAPKQATTATTVKVQGQILSHGIADTVLLAGGEYAGQISFGIYNDKRLAERRRAHLERLGFQVDIKPQTIQKPRIWLHVSAANPEITAKQILEAVEMQSPNMQLAVRPCGYPIAEAGDVLAGK